MTLVVDASAAINALVPGHLRERTLDALEGHDLLAPALVDTEVLSGLARLERAGLVTTAEADAAVRAWQALPCTRVETSGLVAQVWSLRGALRIADAHYVALADALGCAVLTADERLARAPVSGVTFVVVR